MLIQIFPYALRIRQRRVHRQAHRKLRPNRSRPIPAPEHGCLKPRTTTVPQSQPTVNTFSKMHPSHRSTHPDVQPHAGEPWLVGVDQICSGDLCDESIILYIQKGKKEILSVY